MLREIGVKNFKCFENSTFAFRNVNVLTGLNGVGKSTVLQSILLLRQSYFRKKVMDGLYLNGSYVHLGNAQDIIYEKAREEEIGLSYRSDGGSQSFSYQYIPESDFLPLLSSEGEDGSELFQDGFTYLSAFRIEPLELYRITNEEEVNRREFGNNGEFALQYLSLHSGEDLPNPYMILEDKLGNTLLNQTRVWLDRISPGVSPRVMVNTQLRTAEIRYEYIEGKNKTNSYKTVNVGFGITYVLPLVVSLLSAKAGDIVIVENPEAHLHPAGQFMLGELMARAGSGGVQVMVETHSDHIINGLRLAVKNHIIPGEKMQLYFFYKDEEDDYRHKCMQLNIEEDGRLDRWPEGFFDEWEKALYQLI